MNISSSFSFLGGIFLFFLILLFSKALAYPSFFLLALFSFLIIGLEILYWGKAFFQKKVTISFDFSFFGRVFFQILLLFFGFFLVQKEHFFFSREAPSLSFGSLFLFFSLAFFPLSSFFSQRKKVVQIIFFLAGIFFTFFLLGAFFYPSLSFFSPFFQEENLLSFLISFGAILLFTLSHSFSKEGGFFALSFLFLQIALFSFFAPFSLFLFWLFSFLFLVGFLFPLSSWIKKSSLLFLIVFLLISTFLKAHLFPLPFSFPRFQSNTLLSSSQTRSIFKERLEQGTLSFFFGDGDSFPSFYGKHFLQFEGEEAAYAPGFSGAAVFQWFIERGVLYLIFLILFFFFLLYRAFFSDRAYFFPGFFLFSLLFFFPEYFSIIALLFLFLGLSFFREGQEITFRKIQWKEASLLGGRAGITLFLFFLGGFFIQQGIASFFTVRGETELLKGEGQAARDFLQTALIFDSSSPASFRLLAQASLLLFNREKLKEEEYKAYASVAIGASEKALQLDLNDPRNQENLGDVFFGLSSKVEGAAGRAVGFYKEAIKLEPGNAALFVKLSQALFAIHKTGESTKELFAVLQRARILKPNNFEAEYLQALYAYRLGRGEEERDRTEREALLFPQDPATFFRLGSIYYFLNDFSRAKRAFSASLEIDSRQPLAYKLLSEIARKEGRKDEVKQFLLLMEQAEQ